MNRSPHGLFLITVLLATTSAPADDYNPSHTPVEAEFSTHDFIVRDETRSREIPVRVYLSKTKEPVPVILFSHGLGGSCKGSAFLGQHWAAHRYAAVFLQHPGSDDAVWRDTPQLKRLLAMKQAASGKNYLLRVRDIPTVLDRLEAWNSQTGHVLFKRLDLSRVGMSGHSFGAVTTQAVSGQSAPLIGTRFTDPRIDAAIAFSPSGVRRGNPAAVFGAVRIPWMLMTGTKDTAPIGDQTVESRLAVYPYLPASIDRYELVLHNAEHSAFSDRALPGDREPRNPNHHHAILALSTAFWDAHLRNDKIARTWLHSNAARSVLESHDRWQFQTTKTIE